MKMEIISDMIARYLIYTKEAGYYEVSPRDSISKNPIAHAEQICVFAQGEWYLVPTSELRVVVHGYSDLGEPDEAGRVACGCLSTIEVDAHSEIYKLLQKDLQEKGRHLPSPV